MPSIVMQLDGQESDYSRELDAAVRSKFPIGSDEHRSIAYLKAEGFQPNWRERDAPNGASFVREGLLCRKIAQVNWRSGQDGRVTEVTASYASECAVSSPYTGFNEHPVYYRADVSALPRLIKSLQRGRSAVGQDQT